MANETVGFLGLGNLGLPVATNLLNAGHPLKVYNRTPGKGDALAKRGAQVVARPEDAVTPGGVVVSLLWDDASVEGIATEAFLERLGADGIHVGMSTVSPEGARRISALHVKHGCTYVEAPIFGRPEAAAAKKLWVVMAGPAAAKQRVRPLLDAMGAQGVFDFGETIGAATAVKLAGNFMIGSATRSMAEAFTLAEKCGAEPRAVMEMLTTTLFAAPIYQQYGKMLVEKGPTPAGNIFLKDLGLFIETASKVGATAQIPSRLLEMMKSESR